VCILMSMYVRQPLQPPLGQQQSWYSPIQMLSCTPVVANLTGHMPCHLTPHPPTHPPTIISFIPTHPPTHPPTHARVHHGNRDIRNPKP
jgi:hypothetical protein